MTIAEKNSLTERTFGLTPTGMDETLSSIPRSL